MDPIDSSIDLLNYVVTKVAVNPAEKILKKNPKSRKWLFFAYLESFITVLGIAIFYLLFWIIIVMFTAWLFIRPKETDVGVAREEILEGISIRKNMLLEEIRKIENGERQ